MFRPIDESKDRPNWYWLNHKYSSKLKAIKQAVRELYSENKTKFGDLAYYTPHDINHCKRVEDLLHRLIPNKKYKKLTMRERFYLLASAWLHDIGMLKNVYMSIWPSKIPCTISRIRKEHHKTTAQYITENWARLGIEEQDKEILAKLCFFHRKQEDLSNCDEHFLIGNSAYRLRLLAAYLRLADALDICSDRTPAQAYAICLAYNIPNESKLHWIKHRIISGVYLDDKNHKIYIQFKTPQIFTKIYEDLLIELAEKKLKSIENLIVQELRTELYSLMNVLVRNNITYYLDIVPIYSEVPLDAQLVADLREIIINYDIMNAPSASKLLNMILVVVANILGFHLKKNHHPINLYGTSYRTFDPTKQLEKIKEFLKTLKLDILEARPCHLGLQKLVTEIEKQISHSNNLEELLDFINKKFQEHHKRREEIRKNAENFFSKEVIGNANNGPETNKKEKEEERCYNILLYGYSELVTKVLCGFRDALIKKCLGKKYQKEKMGDQFFNSKFEADISSRIKIFICDGQPKTQTSESSNYIYHDAVQFALYLNKRNFNNIIIIPDIISGTVLNCYKIDFLIVGANGITSNFFRHSSGHLGIVKLAAALKKKESDGKGEDCEREEMEKKNEGEEREGKGKEEDAWPKIILVTTTQKIKLNSNQYDSEDPAETLENGLRDDKTKKEASFVLDIEGFKSICLPNCGQNRSQIWLMKDNELINKLQDKTIFFANPREDKIQLDDIDYIILDNKIKELNAKDNDVHEKAHDKIKSSGNQKNNNQHEEIKDNNIKTEGFNVKTYHGYLKKSEWQGFIKYLLAVTGRNKEDYEDAEQ